MFDAIKLEYLKHIMQFYDKPIKLQNLIHHDVLNEQHIDNVLKDITATLNIDKYQISDITGPIDLLSTTVPKFIIQINGVSLTRVSINRASLYSSDFSFSGLIDQNDISKHMQEFNESIVFEEESRKGDVIYIPAGHYHSIQCTDDCFYLPVVCR